MMKKMLLGTIHFYQQAISPYKRQCCRFYPSCSGYAAEAVEKYGAKKGAYPVSYTHLDVYKRQDKNVC